MNDSRVLYRNARRSRQLIQDALLELLATKHIEKIKVKELIALADVSKGTFYAHYTCLQDVLLEIENQQLCLLFRVFDQQSPALIFEDFFPLFYCGLQEMSAHRALYCILFCKSNDRDFPQRVVTSFLDRLLDYAAGNARFQSPQQALDCLTYVAGGSIAVIQRWLEYTPEVPPETVARLLSDCALSGLRGFQAAARIG